MSDDTRKELGKLDRDFVKVEDGDVIRRAVYNPELPEHPDLQKGDVAEVTLEDSTLLLTVQEFGDVFEDSSARYAYGPVSWKPFVERAIETSPDGIEWTKKFGQKIGAKLKRDFLCDLHEREIEQVKEMLEERLG